MGSLSSASLTRSSNLCSKDDDLFFKRKSGGYIRHAVMNNRGLKIRRKRSQMERFDMKLN